MLEDAGALDVYVLTSSAATKLIEARERPFWVSKAAGANEIVDVVVPRSSVRDLPREANAIASATTRSSAGAVTSGTATSTSRSSSPTMNEARRLLLELFAFGSASAVRSRANTASVVTSRDRTSRSPTRSWSTSSGESSRRSTPPAAQSPPPARRKAPAVNGAHALLATLGANGVTTCFANPGTSEMHFVAGLDDAREMRAILCLFEGVAHRGRRRLRDGCAARRRRRCCTSVPVSPTVGRTCTTLVARECPCSTSWATTRPTTPSTTPPCRATSPRSRRHSTVGSAVRRAQTTSRSTPRARSAPRYGPPGRVATLILPGRRVVG